MKDVLQSSPILKSVFSKEEIKEIINIEDKQEQSVTKEKTLDKEVLTESLKYIQYLGEESVPADQKQYSSQGPDDIAKQVFLKTGKVVTPSQIKELRKEINEYKKIVKENVKEEKEKIIFIEDEIVEIKEIEKN